jgi:hypothetical protein
VILGDCELRNIILENKTIIASGALTLGDSVRCALCTFIATKNEVKSGNTNRCLFYSQRKQTISGGSHDSQFFSEDSICVGKNSRFQDMTVLVSRKNIGRLQTDTVQHGGIYYEDGGTYQGFAMCYCDSSAKKGSGARGSAIVMGNACSFIGFLITDGDIELGDDDIEGHLWAKTMVGRKNANKKINWVYARSVKPLQRDMPFPLLGFTPVRIKKTLISCEYTVKR